MACTAVITRRSVRGLPRPGRKWAIRGEPGVMATRPGMRGRARAAVWSAAAAAALGAFVVGAPARATSAGGGPPPQPQCVSAPPPLGWSATAAPVPSNPRLIDVTFTESAVNSYMMKTAGRPAHVFVLEPSDLSAAPAGTKWPVIYLLHGHGGAYADWMNPANGNLQSIVDGSDLGGRAFVVMPDGGYDGFYTDWIGLDADGHNGIAASPL